MMTSLNESYIRASGALAGGRPSKPPAYWPINSDNAVRVDAAFRKLRED